MNDQHYKHRRGNTPLTHHKETNKRKRKIMSTHNAETILSTLSPESVSVLRGHFIAEAAASLTAGLTPAPAPRATRTRTEKPASTEAKRGPGKRQVTNDGTERNASQFIRDCKESMSANEVVEAGKTVGLDFNSMLVYNVRAAVKKKAESAKDEKATAKKAAETQKKKAAALVKARAARKAKAEA